MNVLRERLHLLERRVGQNAVAQIENVTGASTRTSQHIVRCG